MTKIRGIFTLLQMMITISIVIILLYIFKSRNKQIRQTWASLQIKFLGIDIEIQGEEDKDARMAMMNHQSIVDIILFEYLSTSNFAWVAKQEIANIPWFGHILKAPKMIIVQRESKSSLVKLIKDTKDRLQNNRTIAIFPEGTRTDGKKLRKFKAGAKITAQKFELKVQPIIIVGSLNIWDSKKFTQNSGKIKVIYLKSIIANKKTTWYEDTEIEMRNILKKELNK